MVISWNDFQMVDMRAGTILKAEPFKEARKPAIKIWVDLGELGIKKSSAQITDLYTPKELPGKRVVCVVNFAPKQIANFVSEVLITGFPDKNNHIVLCVPDRQIPDGVRLC